MLPLISPKSRELLFKGVSAQDLARYSRQMPIKEYHDLITLAYEETRAEGVAGARASGSAERAVPARPCAVLGGVFLWPLGASRGRRLHPRRASGRSPTTRRSARLYAGDVLYTVGVAAAGTCSPSRSRCRRAAGSVWRLRPVEFLLKVPLFVPVRGGRARAARVLEPLRARVRLVVGRHRRRAGVEAPGPGRAAVARGLPHRRRELPRGRPPVRGRNGPAHPQHPGSHGGPALATAPS